MQQLENDLDQTQEKLMNANQRLEEKEKALQNAEGEVAALNRRGQKRGWQLPLKSLLRLLMLLMNLNGSAKLLKIKVTWRMTELLFLRLNLLKPS